MTDTSAFGFGKFIPGFDFLHSLSQAAPASGQAVPPFSHWVAPTISVEEIEKRIAEFKAVQFWLDQNSKALAATVQALEVQRMTLAALEGMNVNLSQMMAGAPASAQPQTAAQDDLSQWPMSGAARMHAHQPDSTHEEAAREAEAAAQPADSGMETPRSSTAQAANTAAAMQWWSALTQQFQHIAQQAWQDPVQQQAFAQATHMTTELAKTAAQAASEMVKKVVAPVASAPTRQSKQSPQQPAKASPKREKKSTSTDKKATSVRQKSTRTSAQQSPMPAKKVPKR